MIDPEVHANHRLDDDGCPPPAEPQPAPRSYKLLCWDQFDKRAGYPGPGTSNGVRLATRQECEDYGHDLYSRWMGLAKWEVAESDDPVNYRFVDGHAQTLDGIQVS